MSIQKYIQQQIILPRLQRKQVLVVYDPECRYRQLCLDLTSEKRVVVDTSESSLLSRAAAMKTLQLIGQNKVEQLLIYVPKSKPLMDEDKQKDPFSFYAECGSLFPESDGDSFLSLCLKAKPDYQTQIRSVFAKDPNPSFSVIDAIGGGLTWPNLKATLKASSVNDILFSILHPSEYQQGELRANSSWVSELKELVNSTFGLHLKTKSVTWSPIADELWRFLLFSEFVFDLPEELPTQLEGVPYATKEAQPIIEDLCDRLRNDKRTQHEYIQRAEQIELELNLQEICGSISNLGVRDTFPFEERTFLLNTIEALKNDQIDEARTILTHHAQSVWSGKGESQIQWDFLQSSLTLIERCTDVEREVVNHTHSLDSIIDFYVTKFREVDKLHREFEQAVSDYVWRDTRGILHEVTEYTRKEYSILAEKIHIAFTSHFKTSGWSNSTKLANNQVFDRFVAPKLEINGTKTAFILVDALRYELGVALFHQLPDDIDKQLVHARAQLPSITVIGMASLLPGASPSFKVRKTPNGIAPEINGKQIQTVQQRMELFKSKYGQRFQEGRLEEFVRSRFTISDDTDLLVLRSIEIDSHFENNPETALSESNNALKRIIVAIHKLREQKFTEIIIATDHGFCLNTHIRPGDTCPKPSGNWITVHDRALLGDGESDENHFYLDTYKVGIEGDFRHFAGPLGLASYKNGMMYFHGGVSLQECIVPVISLHVSKEIIDHSASFSVDISYKNGLSKIKTRLPVFDIEVIPQNLFAITSDVEILLEAHDAKGNVIGEAKPSTIVNAATGTISLKPNVKERVTVKMSLEFEGKFTLKVLNPNTLATYCQLNLETDYTV